MKMAIPNSNTTPTDPINGKFSMGDGWLVYFSQGNLQQDIIGRQQKLIMIIQQNQFTFQQMEV